MADSRRLFFALWPDEPVRRALLRARGQLEAFNGRPNHRSDLHVTLVFLGAVSAEQQSCVEAVADGIRGKPFELAIDQFGFWPKPRILWCGPSEMPDSLKELVRDLQNVSFEYYGVNTVTGARSTNAASTFIPVFALVRKTECIVFLRAFKSASFISQSGLRSTLFTRVTQGLGSSCRSISSFNRSNDCNVSDRVPSATKTKPAAPLK